MSIVYDAMTRVECQCGAVYDKIDALRADNRRQKRMLRYLMEVNDVRRDDSDGVRYGRFSVAADSSASESLPVPMPDVPPWDTDNG